MDGPARGTGRRPGRCRAGGHDTTTVLVGLVVASAHAGGGGALPAPPAPLPGENANQLRAPGGGRSRGDPARRHVYETAAVVHDAVAEGRAASGVVVPVVPAPWLEPR